MIYAAVMGYGTIGSGVCEILEKNKEKIAAAAGQPIEVKYVLDLREFPGTPVEDKVIHDFSVIEKDPEVRLAVETMGGLDPAYSYVKSCLLAGKHVATSNKALVAAYGTELLAIAREKNVNFQFEASVGGGIPIVRTMNLAMAGDEILEITGILNGTTNYILTKMGRENRSFAQALAEAQALGYAEQDPEADVEGYDTCRKIAILTALASGKEVDYRDIPTEGITEISTVDLRYADKLGMSVKLAGCARLGGGETAAARVAPLMIGKGNPLYGVNDVYNAVLVKGKMLGTSMYYGSGAGKLPTASAVIADLIEEARNLENHVLMGWKGEKLTICPEDHEEYRYFLRISGSPGKSRDTVERNLGECQIVLPEGLDEFGVLTEAMEETAFGRGRDNLSRALSIDGERVLRIIRAEKGIVSSAPRFER